MTREGEECRGEGDGLAALESAVASYQSRYHPGSAPAWLRERLLRLRHLIDLLELEFSAGTAELAACGEEEWQGHTSPIQWIKHECRVSTSCAVDALHVGTQAERLAASRVALCRAEIGFGHLALLARTARWMEEAGASAAEPGAGPGPDSTACPHPVLPFNEAALLRKAHEHSVSRFRHDCEHARHACDPRRFLEDQVDQVRTRVLELKACEGGALFLRGYLDTEGGATLRTALEPLARRQDEGDLRSRGRRLADALVELAGHALDTSEVPQHAGQRPHLQVTAALETLRGEAGAPAAELELGGPVAAETARRLGCDAQVSRVVFGPRSQVLDVGRATRGARTGDPARTAGPRPGLRLAQLRASRVVG